MGMTHPIDIIADRLPATSRDQFDPFRMLMDPIGPGSDDVHHVVDHLGARIPIRIWTDCDALVVDNVRIMLGRSTATYVDGTIVLDDGMTMLTLVADAATGYVAMGEYGFLPGPRDGRGTSLQGAIPRI